jgi:ABC-2 type transport system permease protein
VSVRPGTFTSFVAHDLRIGARGFAGLFGALPPHAAAAIVVAGIVGLHVLAWPAALWFSALERGPDGAKILAAAMRSGVCFVLPWVVASTMTTITRMLYRRGDFDLILASPVSPRNALAARLFAIAIESVASVGLLLLPFANANALQGRPHWLALYPALFAAGLFGAGLGLMLALGLFFAVGPRRARVVSQVAATLMGASAVLSAQVVAMLPDWARAKLFDALAANRGGDALRRLASLPERAAEGEPAAIIGWIAAALALFMVAVFLFAGGFARAALQSAGAPSAPARGRKRTRFSARLGPTLRVKEHRLLWRDPWLLSQMMLQILYTLPVGIILWRNGGATGAAGVAFGPTLVVIAGQLAGSLAWIALSAEDAPDFLATAPATRGEIERGKLAAIAIPVVGIMALPMVGLAFASPWGALCALICGAGASLSAALLMLWRQAPARRGLVLRRHSQAKWVALVEHWLSLLWAVATGVAVFGSLACVIPVALVAFTLWLLRPRSRDVPEVAPRPVAA